MWTSEQIWTAGSHSIHLLPALGDFSTLPAWSFHVPAQKTLTFTTSTAFHGFNLPLAPIQRKLPISAFCRFWQLLKDTVLASFSRFLVPPMYVTLHYFHQLLKNPGSVASRVFFSTKTRKSKHQGNSIYVSVFVSRSQCLTKIPWKTICDLSFFPLSKVSFLALILAGFVNEVQKKNIIKINVSLGVPR